MIGLFSGAAGGRSLGAGVGAPAVSSAPTVIDNLFDDGVSGTWTGSLGGASISLITDPTGSFGSRQVAEHAFSINSGSHTDHDIYRYYDGYSSPEVYVAIDVEFTNVTQASAQRKLIYLKGDRNYSGFGTSWTVILTAYIGNLIIAGDPHSGSTFSDTIGTGVLSVNVPYRLELGVKVNTSGASDGFIKVWLTNLDTGPGSRTLLLNDLNKSVDATTGATHDPNADRIQVGDQLDNGGFEGSLVADDRIFDRMMISANEIGTWGL